MSGFAATGASHDVLQFPTSMFANAAAVLNNASLGGERRNHGSAGYRQIDPQRHRQSGATSCSSERGVSPLNQRMRENDCRAS